MIYNTLHIYATELGATTARNKSKSLLGKGHHICKGEQVISGGYYVVELHCPLYKEDMNWFIGVITPRIISRN